MYSLNPWTDLAPYHGSLFMGVFTVNVLLWNSKLSISSFRQLEKVIPGIKNIFE
jgi:hypothetical protein